MKIAIASDLHFGYAWDGERQEDSFIQGKEAINKCLEGDAIILPGDIFDSRVPKQEIMDKAMRILSLPSFSPSQAKIEQDRAVTIGTPVIAIHGTHERRAKGLTNPVQLLEAAGLCIALHGTHTIISMGDEKVAIHGMGGVPEQYAPSVLQECAFTPLPGMINILVLHQSFREYIYEDAAFLSMDDLPPGFDLYVNGHIHWSDIKEKNNRILFHPGSTILTQMNKTESIQPKKIWFYDTKTKEITHQDLETPRKLFIIEIEAKGSTQDVIDKARNELEKITISSPTPLVKLKITGELPPGSSLDKKEITRGFNLIINIDSSIEVQQFKKKIEVLRQTQAKKSIDEIGLTILQQNLEQAGYSGVSAVDLLPLLEHGKEDEALKLIFGKQSL